MDNILRFIPRPKSDDQKQREALETDKYVSMWFNEEGEISYLIGEGISIEQLTFMAKFLDLMLIDKFKEELSYKVEE